MVFAIIMLVLLLISFLYNIGNFASNMVHGGRSSRFATRTAGPRLEEIVLEDNDASDKIAVVEIQGIITGRQLEHWHTGAITRRATVLDHIEPEPVASLHPLDLDQLGAKPGEIVTVQSRRGKIALYARADEGTPAGAVFIPFCYYEAAANLLTNPVLDPVGKIPEFKYCAVKVTKGGPVPVRASFGGGQALAAEKRVAAKA